MFRDENYTAMNENRKTTIEKGQKLKSNLLSVILKIFILFDFSETNAQCSFNSHLESSYAQSRKLADRQINVVRYSFVFKITL